MNKILIDSDGGSILTRVIFPFVLAELVHQMFRTGYCFFFETTLHYIHLYLNYDESEKKKLPCLLPVQME